MPATTPAGNELQPEQETTLQPEIAPSSLDLVTML
jgi:hypothetical protein